MKDQAEPTVREVVDQLRNDISDFSASVNKLAETVVDNVAQLGKYGRRTRRMAIGLAVSLALDLGLTGYLAYTNARISAVQERTSDEVLCPLYGLIVSGYHPELRAPGPARDEYVADYQIILRGYQALSCHPVAPVPSPDVVPGSAGTGSAGTSSAGTGSEQPGRRPPTKR